MKQKLLLLTLGVLSTFPALARDFDYSYKGHTLTYTVIDEEAKTCMTKAGGNAGGWYAGNSVDGELILPSNPNDGDYDFTLTTIGEYSFFNNELTSVEIPNSVTEIGEAAFEACIGLKSIEIPNSVTSIGWKAFMDCSGLTSVEIPNSVTSIRDYAFYGCNSLTSVTIPQSVNELYCPFPACENLKEIIVEDGNEYYVSEKGVLYNHDKTCIIQCPGGKSEYELPNTVTKIGQSAFYGCSGLTSMEISSSVTSIDLCAFFNCRGLTSVVIPSSVSELAWSAFYGCSSLTSVAIGCSITQIGPNTFINCPISNLYITVQTPPLMSSNPFNDYSCKLWLQGESALEKYKTAMTWKDFATTELMIEPTSMETDGLASLSGNAGDTFQLNARLIPEDVTLPYIFWRSTNPQIATVDNNGLVTLQKYSAEGMNLADGDEDNCGICRIIAETLYFDGPIAEFTIENTDFNAVESVTIGNDDSIDYSRPYDVYNMNGFKAGESTEGLPKGFYIIRQGKAAVKTVVK